MKRLLRRLTGGVMALCLLLSLSAPALATGETTVFTGIDTLMIYNPLTNQRRTMSTGSMTGQVGRDRTNAALLDDVQLSGLEEPGEGFYFADQDSLLEELTAIQTTDLRDLEELFPDAEGPTQEIPEEGPAAPDSDPDLMQPQEGMAEDGLHFADQDAMQEELPRNEGLPDSGEEEDDASLFSLGDQVGDGRASITSPGTATPAPPPISPASTSGPGAASGAMASATRASPTPWAPPLTTRSSKTIPMPSARPGTFRTATS